MYSTHTSELNRKSCFRRKKTLFSVSVLCVLCTTWNLRAEAEQQKSPLRAMMYVRSYTGCTTTNVCTDVVLAVKKLSLIAPFSS